MRIQRLSLAALLGLLCASCPAERRGTLDPHAFWPTPLESVLERHDAYVEADPSLEDLEREIYLGSSEAVRSTVELAVQLKEQGE